MKKIDHKLFIHTLKINGITQKAFSEYAKIPYDTVTGWKKKGKVPAYAMVIARDMAYRMRLDEKTLKTLQRNQKRNNTKVIGLDITEQKRIEAVFWGTNYTVGEIIKKIQNGDKRFIEKLKKNIPETLYNKIINTQVKHNV